MSLMEKLALPRTPWNPLRDYSPVFTQAVESLHRFIEAEITGPVEHDDDMNYSSAQKLVVWLDERSQIVTSHDPKAVYRLIIFVSSRGRFFAFITLGLTPAAESEKGSDKQKQYWSLIAEENLPDGIKKLQKKIASIMEANGFESLEDSVWLKRQTAIGQNWMNDLYYF